MPAHSPNRRRLASKIAGTEKSGGPQDPRLPALRRQLEAETVAEDLESAAHRVREWAARIAASLPPLGETEVGNAGRLAAALDARARNGAA